MNNLAHYLEASASRWPDRTAVVDPSGQSISYSELLQKADALAGFLTARGIKKGDRVGVVLPKSISTIISIFGILKAGAVFVPVDFTAPLERGRKILEDCQIRALIVDSRSLAILSDETKAALAAVITVEELAAMGTTSPVPSFPSTGPTDLAYILYTSGSTGIPKGVMITHENALSFVDWCSSVFLPTEKDRFSSHAPFHFDLSVLDLYLAIKHGATVYLISEELGKSPKELAMFIAANKLTVWYSTPSILTLLVQFGDLAKQDASSLRLVLFAGEVFPIKHLREVKRIWPKPDYYNLYGPTETNVCTFARIPPSIPDDRSTPYPIGFPCSHCLPLVLDTEGKEVPMGGEGLLYISGASVFQGYWNRPTENAAAFIQRGGVRWYNTGDVVRWDPADGFIYLGRKDRMVKRRGYRIELGEIERALYLNPKVREAAVISIPDPESGVSIVAFLACQDGPPPSIIDLKTFCASKLPAYMIPDRFMVQERLPKTSTDKIDYQTLRRGLQEIST